MTSQRENSPPKLVEQQSVCDEDTEQNHQQVQRLAQTEVEVVAEVARSEVEKILANVAGVTVLKKQLINIWNLFFRYIVLY